MYNFPIIPIVLFAFMIVPPIVIGFFRGWKASLFIALSTLALIGIEVGVAFVIYDSLWDMLNRFIIDDLQPGLPKDALKEIGKSTIIILFIGLCMLPTYAIVMGVYFPLNKLLRRHMFPKTTEINEHQKTIKRSVHWISRTSGVAIASTSGLFFASSASSAAASLFTPLEKRSNFTDFTSDVARLYTFGNATNDKALQIINRFAKEDLTKEYQDHLSNIFYLGQQDANAQIAASTLALSSGRFHDRLLEVARNDQSIIAISDLILMSSSMSSKPKFFLKDMAYQELLADGTPDAGAPLHADFNNMDTLLDSYTGFTHLNLHLNGNVVNGILEKIKDKTIRTFEETAFYKQWLDGANFIKYLSNKEKSLLDRLNGYKAALQQKLSELSKIYADINEDERNIKRLGMTAGVPDSYKYTSPNQPITVRTSNSEGTIRQIEMDIVSLTAAIVAAKNAMDASQAIFNPIKTQDDANKAQAENDNNAMLVARGQMDTAQQELDSTTAALQLQQKRLADNTSAYNSITEAHLNSLIAAYEAAHKNSEDLKNQIVAVDASIASLRNEENTRRQENQNDISAVTQVEALISRSEADVADKRNTLGNNENRIRSMNAVINDKTSKKANAESQLANPSITDAKKTELTNLVASLEADITRVQSQVNALEADNITLKAEIQTLDATIQMKKAELTPLRNHVTLSQNLLNAAMSQRASEETKRQQLSTQKVQQDQMYADKFSQYTNDKASKDYAKSEMDAANGLIPGLTSDKAAKESALQSMTVAYNAAKATADKSMADFDAYHHSTFLPAKQDLDDKTDYWNKLRMNLVNKQNDLAKNANDKANLIAHIETLTQNREAKVAEIYSASDSINNINGKTIPTHTGEKHHEGTLKPKETYTPKHSQTPAYTNWGLNTLPGIQDYIVNAGKDTSDFKSIMEDERAKYKKLEEKYLAKIAEILKS